MTNRENPTYLFSLNATQLVITYQYKDTSNDLLIDLLGTSVYYDNPNQNEIIIYHNGVKAFNCLYSDASNRSFNSSKDLSDFIQNLLTQGYIGLAAVPLVTSSLSDTYVPYWDTTANALKNSWFTRNTNGMTVYADKKLYFANGTNSNLVSLSAGVTASSVDYVLPITAPTAGQVLTATAPSGGVSTLSWTTNGAGTVTDVSVVSANGFAGTVATSTTTPAITLSTTITGILKGNGTAISAAVAGTDYQAPITLTTTGTSGAATFIANTLNIPQYQGAGNYWTQGGNAFGALGVLGTLDAYGLSIKTNNVERIAISNAGVVTVQTLTVGLGASAIATNTAIGVTALNGITTGYHNVGVGHEALKANTTGIDSTAVGYQALNLNTTGQSNNAFGSSALAINVDGNYNNAFGNLAGSSNVSGNYLSAFGHNSARLATGIYNDGFGAFSLYNLTTGVRNVGMGANAVSDLTTGDYNTGLGFSAGSNNQTGSNNINIGYRAWTSATNISNEFTLGLNTDIATPLLRGDLSNLRLGIATTNTTARLVLPANSASASGAQLKLLLGGSLMATPENGAIEAINSHIYWTDSTGTRRQLDQQTGSGGAGIIIGTTPITSGTTTRVLYDNGGTLGEYSISGSGSVAMTTSPSFTTPTLGAATATTINKLTFTTPATGATLTIADSKTLAVNNTLTFAGTDSTTITFQGTDTYVGRATTDTLTNKRITARTGTVASSATPTINTDNVDFYSITALAADITSMTTNLSGTPTDAQTLWLAITDNGTARAITWGTSFESSLNSTLPTTTVISTRMDICFIWNTATSKWRCVGVS